MTKGKEGISGIISDFIALIYPSCCDACKGELVKGEDILCTSCLLELPRTNYHLERFNPLFKRLHGRIRLSYALAFFKFRKSGKVQALLHALKYHNRPDIGQKLGKVYGMELRLANYMEKFDVVVPVPLHTVRKRQRGYNQSEEFAKGLCASLDVPLDTTLLKRTVRTQTQTKRTRLNRWKNVQDVFEVTDPLKVTGRRILLVDDIATTGATLEACSVELLKAGCAELSIAAIAVTQ